MRATFALVLAVALGACGSGGPDDDDGITYCWHFRTPNTKRLAIKKWASSMTPGSHHLILYTGQSDAMPPGTVTTVNCGPGGSGISTWMYSSQTPEDSLEMPTDDGEGKPLAMEIEPNQAGFLQMHYNNTEWGYEHFIMDNDGEALIWRLKAALRYEELALEDQIPYDDWRKGKWHDA